MKIPTIVIFQWKFECNKLINSNVFRNEIVKLTNTNVQKLPGGRKIRASQNKVRGWKGKDNEPSRISHQYVDPLCWKVIASMHSLCLRIPTYTEGSTRSCRFVRLFHKRGHSYGNICNDRVHRGLSLLLWNHKVMTIY